MSPTPTSGSPAPAGSRFELIGGRPSLDFANTASRLGTAAPIERLHGYGDLVRWALEAGILGDPQARRLREEAARHPTEADRVLGEARRLRGAIWRIFVGLKRGTRAAPADLATLNRALAEGMASRRLHESPDGYRWAWEEQPGRLDWPLWPVAHSAAELASGDQVDRVKVCEGGECGWLFVDASRNRSRRWCSMEDCGNVVKARRHYAKRKRTG